MRIINLINTLLRYPRMGFTRKHVNDFMNDNFQNYNNDKTKILDVGAGYKPYEKFFLYSNYESCDHSDALIEIGDGNKYKHNFYCDITKKIPVKDNYYDIIICNEVLEHVNEPANALNELYRILKPAGKLYITTTQCHGLHQEPHNYFNYLSYGLKYLLNKNKFHIIELRALGGIYHLLGKILQNIVESIFMNNKKIYRLILYPVEFLIRIFLLFLSIILYHIDFLDKKKKWTINYGCICKK